MNRDYQRGVDDAFYAWAELLREAYPTLGNFITPPEFVAEMNAYITRMEDRALARVLHHFQRDNNPRAATAVRFYMGRQQ